VREPRRAQRWIRNVPRRAALVLACLVPAGCAADATTPRRDREIAPRVVVTQDDVRIGFANGLGHMARAP
jgi:hypothetical protein